ncbi:hypothetical protein O1L68_13570 [Streptomyces lydicus]|nr:hypothetical protein [Streptomyces lydicus]
MHRHQELCARAVDALEIAAGLEAHGVTDRTAARFRHRDVFSLAEELYARVPRAEAPDARPDEQPHLPVPVPARGSRGVRVVLQLLPGAVCVAAVAALASAGTATPPYAPVSARRAVRWSPSPSGWPSGPGRCDCATGAPDRGPPACGSAGRPDTPSTATGCSDSYWPAALTCPAARPGPPSPPPWPWPSPSPRGGCARWFAARGRRGVAASRGLGELAARVRPLLLAATLLFLGALVALLLGADAVFGSDGTTALAAAAALGVLLFLARLLAVHGFPDAAATGLASAAALEALALSLVLIARLPGLPRSAYRSKRSPPPWDRPPYPPWPARPPPPGSSSTACGRSPAPAHTGRHPPARRRRTGRDPPYVPRRPTPRPLVPRPVLRPRTPRPPTPRSPTWAPPPRTTAGAAPRNGRFDP